jgi:hypothetical protein
MAGRLADRAFLAPPQQPDFLLDIFHAHSPDKTLIAAVALR